MWPSILLSSLTLVIVNNLGNATPIMGPAEVVMKFTEKCKLSLPTMLDMEVRLYSRKGKLILQTNVTSPFELSDDLGYQMNLAVKRNGGWKPNFMKFQGKGVCSAVKTGEPNLFKALAKAFKAQEPAKCPLITSGGIYFDYSGADPTSALKKYGMDVLPYGEFRITTNVTLKEDILFCYRLYVDLVPKKNRGK